jgi:hypothetical protein
MPRISIQAAKAKGRKLQQFVCEAIYAACPQLDRGDIKSCPMGSAGEDVIMSAAARTAFPFAIECKSRANGFTPLYAYLDQADRGDIRTAIAVVKQDRKRPLVVIDFEDFMALVSGYEG